MGATLSGEVLSEEVNHMIKFYLNPIELRSSIEDNGATRPPTSGERQQITRLMKEIERGYDDPNIDDFYVSPEMSHRDFLLLLSSGCPQVIEMALLLQALQGDWKIYPDQEASLLIGILAIEPRLFPLLLQSKGWRWQDDTQNTLKVIGIRYHWIRRPRKKTRKRGYQDHGSLSDSQQKLRNLSLSSYYIEQFEMQRYTDKETIDTLELLAGLIM